VIAIPAHRLAPGRCTGTISNFSRIAKNPADLSPQG